MAAPCPAAGTMYPVHAFHTLEVPCSTLLEHEFCTLVVLSTCILYPGGTLLYPASSCFLCPGSTSILYPGGTLLYPVRVESTLLVHAFCTTYVFLCCLAARCPETQEATRGRFICTLHLQVALGLLWPLFLCFVPVNEE